FELIWVRADLTQLTAAPVYSANGVTALAELYVATNNGLTYALDANTGATLHTYEGGGEVVNGLALSDTAVIASGGAFVKAYDRRSNGLFWRAATNGEMRNAAIVTPDQLLVVALNGAIQFFNPSSGAMTGVFNVPTSVTNAPAIGGANLYVAGEDGQLYAFTQ
ncbi:MAG: PQQ-binding-like beta-propeller repeat protein, partial [Caldilineaceae bacterium]|nr:PQQ-binding-like beta-propeller repeat protein [Caldilineaceae bacterium]